MNNKLFVGFSSGSVISVLDADTLGLLHNLTIDGLRCVTDIASCLDCDEIYISDRCGNKIFVVGEHGVKSQWPVPEQPWGISVNSRRNLVVAFRWARTIREYSPGGQMIREIRLPSDMTNLRHAIQLRDNQYTEAQEYCIGCASSAAKELSSNRLAPLEDQDQTSCTNHIVWLHSVDR